MANAKKTFQTPLLPLSWVNVRGKGKLKMEKDPNSTDPNDYNYTATVTFPDEESMKPIKAIFDKFWREHKPQGAGKQNYEMFKPVMVPTLDAQGKEQRDEDDEIIKHHTGEYTLAAKTVTQWPDGKQNVVKLLGSNGKPLMEGHGLEEGCGEATMGILHGAIGINAYPTNMGLAFYLNGVQLKESTYTEYTGGSDINAMEIEDDVAEVEVEVEDTSTGKVEV